MTHQNLMLTEEAIKGHCKRLKKELQNINQDLPLMQVQNLFSRTLGFNNFHELKKVLGKGEENLLDSPLKKGTLVSEKYKKNLITKRKFDLLQYVLLDEYEKNEYEIPQNFIDLWELVITSDLNKVIHFIENNEVDITYQIPKRTWTPKNLLEFASFFDQYEIVKYFISKQVFDLNLSQEYLLRSEAQSGDNVAFFKYLCSKLPYTQLSLNDTLLYASEKSLEITKYLLNDKSLSFNADIHYKNDDCLKSAIYGGRLDILKYLLESTDLIEKPSLYTKKSNVIGKVTDIRDDLIQKIKVFTNQIKNSDGTPVIYNFSKSEKDNFFNMLNYLTQDYHDKKFVNWLYLKEDLRPYINKEDIDVDILVSMMK